MNSKRARERSSAGFVSGRGCPQAEGALSPNPARASFRPKRQRVIIIFAHSHDRPSNRQRTVAISVRGQIVKNGKRKRKKKKKLLYLSAAKTAAAAAAMALQLISQEITEPQLPDAQPPPPVRCDRNNFQSISLEQTPVRPPVRPFAQRPN